MGPLVRRSVGIHRSIELGGLSLIHEIVARELFRIRARDRIKVKNGLFVMFDVVKELIDLYFPFFQQISIKLRIVVCLGGSYC